MEHNNLININKIKYAIINMFILIGKQPSIKWPLKNKKYYPIYVSLLCIILIVYIIYVNNSRLYDDRVRLNGYCISTLSHRNKYLWKRTRSPAAASWMSTSLPNRKLAHRSSRSSLRPCFWRIYDCNRSRRAPIAVRY